ncbi:SusC/RagA family TonB-linked outer membrane protein [Odoribacter splanchnicus]|uniref:SusC/RagA family TonB-linked outer membrane protein n=2 Tax=Odoribacter splanchnicus TaxID=28118 RepID=A0A413I3F6_9BACT|nr:SusC/RagA family TonB-linked outer membrane protein [Odoribacter splanchnicus]
MKKNRDLDIGSWPDIVRKMYLTMKICVCMLILGLSTLSARTHSQIRLTLDAKNKTLPEVFQEITRLSGYEFMYSSNELRHVGKVSVQLEDRDLSDILAECLKNTGLWYRLEDDVIIISPKLVSPQKVGEKLVVTGLVKDKGGMPLPGVTILLKGTQLGGVTDADGNFRLTLPGNTEHVLIFSFVGMKTREIKVNDAKPLTVVMEEDAREMDEVVVVAYGTQLKRNVTGSIASVDDFKPQESQVGNVITGLQGRVSGLWVRKLSGDAGANPEFVIRGHQSSNLSVQPLIVIDGMIVDGTSNFNLNNIAPQDIESIEVLKDAASSAMYGSRGAMGVILITTKKGKFNSKPVVNLSAYYGWASTPFNYRMLNAEEYEMVFREGRENRIADIRSQLAAGGLSAGEQATLQEEIATWRAQMNTLNMGKQEVDWLDYVIPNSAAKSDIHLSLNGGNDKTTYYFSVGRTAEENTIGKGDYSRLNTKLALTSQVYKWLKLSADVSVTQSVKKRYTSSADVLRMGEIRPDTPEEPLYDEDGRWDWYFGYQDHPVLALTDNNNKEKIVNTTGNFGVDINLIKGLVWTSRLAGTINNRRYESFNGPKTYDGIDYDGHSITANSFLNYNVDIQKLNIAATLGYEYNENYSKSYVMDIGGFPDIPGLEGPANGSEYLWADWNISGNTRWTERSESYFFRANLSYNRKYLLGFSIRRDGTSKLAKENRYSNFPAVSAGWVISDEAFMSRQHVINLLKLRTSYGMTGSITNVSMADCYDRLSSDIYWGKPALSVASTLGNPDLQWEKTNQVDVGVDLALFQNRLTLIAEWYLKRTSGMMNSEPLPSSTGGYTSRKINAGTIRNSGVDLALNFQHHFTKDWGLTAGINMNINRSKVIDLPVDNWAYSSAYYGGGNTPRPRLKIGQSFGALEMYRALGLDERGDIIYDDVSGNGSIDAADKVIIDNLTPKFTGGLNLGVSWKNLSLFGQFSFTYGGKIYNLDEQLLRSTELGYDDVMKNKPDYILDRWTQENQSSRYPRFVVGAHGAQNETGWNDRPSTLYLFDASFLKLNKLTLSYNLPQNWIQKLGMTSCSVYLSGENLFTLKNKKLNVPDPEAALTSGIAQKGVPSPRSFMIGLDLTF